MPAHIRLGNSTPDHQHKGQNSDPKGLFELLCQSAARFPDATALQAYRSGEWTRLSYREVLTRANQWGEALAAVGVAPCSRVLLVAESAPAWGIAYFAVVSRRATVVPLDPHLSPTDLCALAYRTHARVWLVSRSVAARLGTLPIDLPDPVTLLELEAFTGPPPEARGQASEVEPAGEEETASILFTSGTTLAPKGVPLTHRNFCSNVDALLSVIHFTGRDRLVSVLPMHHALEFTGGFLAPLRVGATITYLERLTPKHLVEAMQGTGATTMIGVPRACALLARTIETGMSGRKGWPGAAMKVALSLARASCAVARALPPLAPVMRALRRRFFRPVHQRLGGQLRLIVTGGAALPPGIYDALDRYGFIICEGYGLTETSPVLAVNDPRRPRRGTVGPPLPGVEIRIEEAETEGVGAVLARGPGVFSGYLDDPEATRAAFEGAWFRTGDLGRFDRSGALVLAGRADDVIVTGGGKNVYPVEVEWLYQSLPYVKELCVIGIPDPASAGEAVHVVIVEDDSGDAPAKDTRRPAIETAVSDISRSVAPHQRVRGIHYWEGDLPRTSTLKIKRRQVQAAIKEEPVSSA